MALPFFIYLLRLLVTKIKCYPCYDALNREALYLVALPISGERICLRRFYIQH